ncbi:MAG: hypothetical protein EXS67_02240 [Candidatus Margulisbacteria bacterium]|nr:hypothetical protein [Candidatus Margulisiibacteriota bacterium]
MTPDSLLAHFSDFSAADRQYWSNSLLTLGASSLAGSFLLQDEALKESLLITGTIYTGVGFLLTLLPSQAEILQKKVIESAQYTAKDAVEELRSSEETMRYIAAGVFILPLFFDLSGNTADTLTHPEDINTAIKIIAASASISMLIFKTPLEKLCEKALHNTTPPSPQTLNIHIQPGLTETKIVAAYTF